TKIIDDYEIQPGYENIRMHSTFTWPEEIEPTVAPTAAPTEAPKPTEAPTEAPKPTEAPTEAPKPTQAPTEAPKPTQAPTEAPKPTQAPTEAPTEAPVTITDGYYLVGTMTEWKADSAYKFSENTANPGEYMLSTTLAASDGIKAVKVENGKITTWYPGGVGDEYVVDAAHAGDVTVYFKATYQSDWSTFGGYLYIDGGSAPTPDMITVKFTNTNNWSNVHAYCWDEDGNEPLGEWPGTAMTNAGGNVYSAQIPANSIGLIFNNGDTYQTVDIDEGIADGAHWKLSGQMDGTNYKVAPVSDTDPTTAPQPTDPTPSITDGYYLVGTMTEWKADAAYKFSENTATPGEYMLSTTLSATDGIKAVKVENGTITTWYPDGMDNEYTVDAAHAGDVTIYFKTTYQSDWSTFGGYLYIDGGSTPTPDPTVGPTEASDVTDRTIIFSNNKGFGTVNIYYWSENDQPVDWPGVPMTYLDTNELGEKRYTIELPAGMTEYVINDGGTQQTIDITFAGATGVYMTDKDSTGNYDVAFYDIGGTDPTPDPTTAPQPTTPTPSGKDVTFEPGDAGQADPAWFAWVWNDNSEGTWIQGTASGSNIVFAGAADYGNILVVRMPTGSTSADWDTCWNQSEDIKMQSGTLYFTGWGSGNKFNIGWK
ncbi:starch-binding protein, partial [Ruminococcus sp.]|uniref:starch-binding protein n=1 Tax=Ruminococcus sp. TaxID=41978 RepID=UPI003868BB39